MPLESVAIVARFFVFGEIEFLLWSLLITEPLPLTPPRRLGLIFDESLSLPFTTSGVRLPGFWEAILFRVFGLLTGVEVSSSYELASSELD